MGDCAKACSQKHPVPGPDVRLLLGTKWQLGQKDAMGQKKKPQKHCD